MIFNQNTLFHKRLIDIINMHGGETLNLMTGADISTFTSEVQFGVHQGSKLSESTQRLFYGCTHFLPLVH